VSSYRPPIVTYSVSLRVSEILPLLCSRTPFFCHPTSSLPKISPCSPMSRWMTFGLRRAKVLGLVSVQLVSKLSNLCGPDPPTSQTDRRTTSDGKTALCTIVHRAVKTNRRKREREFLEPQTTTRALVYSVLIILLLSRKPCYRKDDRAICPVYGCPEKFRESIATPTATFPEIANGLLL